MVADRGLLAESTIRELVLRTLEGSQTIYKRTLAHILRTHALGHRVPLHSEPTYMASSHADALEIAPCHWLPSFRLLHRVRPSARQGLTTRISSSVCPRVFRFPSHGRVCLSYTPRGFASFCTKMTAFPWQVLAHGLSFAEHAANIETH